MLYHLPSLYILTNTKNIYCTCGWMIYFVCKIPKLERFPVATKKTVQFEAHKNVTKPVKVGFKTKDGPVKFTAKEVVKVPVHVKFKAKNEV
jgi:hypothetical protein